MPEPQKIVMTCSICKAEHSTVCTSGSVKTHITRFAFVHYHKDSFADQKPIKRLALKPV